MEACIVHTSGLLLRMLKITLHMRAPAYVVKLVRWEEWMKRCQDQGRLGDDRWCVQQRKLCILVQVTYTRMLSCLEASAMSPLFSQTGTVRIDPLWLRGCQKVNGTYCSLLYLPNLLISNPPQQPVLVWLHVMALKRISLEYESRIFWMLVSYHWVSAPPLSVDGG